MENQKHIEAYQDLFNYLYESCGATLLQSEMDEIIDLSLKVKEKYNKASDGKKQQPYTTSKAEGVSLPSSTEIKAELVDRLGRLIISSELEIRHKVGYESGFLDCIQWLKRQ